MGAAHTYWIGNAPFDIEIPNLFWHFKKERIGSKSKTK
jgi:hypothetical protein